MLYTISRLINNKCNALHFPKQRSPVNQYRPPVYWEVECFKLASGLIKTVGSDAVFCEPDVAPPRPVYFCILCFVQSSHHFNVIFVFTTHLFLRDGLYTTDPSAWTSAKNKMRNDNNTIRRWGCFNYLRLAYKQFEGIECGAAMSMMI